MVVAESILEAETVAVETMAKTHSFYKVELNYLNDELSSNVTYGFVVVGPPRIGKSELLNAVTGSKLHTTPSIDSVTKGVTEVRRQVTMLGEEGEKKSERAVVFYDTPGIEEWKDFDSQIKFFAKDKIIISYMLCLAPGCFADTQKLQSLVETLTKDGVYVQLIITDMYRGNDSQFGAVLSKYREIADLCGWKKKGEDVKLRDVKITFDKGMIISVNSLPFEHAEFGVFKGVLNIQDMIEIMFRSIDKKKLAGVFFAIMNNRMLIKKIWHKIKGILQETAPFWQNYANEALNQGLQWVINRVLEK